MRIDPERLQEDYDRWYRRRHASTDRLRRRSRPYLTDYDYLLLAALSRNVVEVLSLLTPTPGDSSALDVGSALSPYRALLGGTGFEVKTLDVDAASQPDFQGTVARHRGRLLGQKQQE